MSFIDRVVAHHQSRNRPDSCGVMVWLQAQASRLAGLSGGTLEAEEDAIRGELCAHEGWSPNWSAEGVLVAWAYAEPRRSVVQAIYANDIAQAEPIQAGKIARLMLQMNGKKLTASARAILEAVA